MDKKEFENIGELKHALKKYVGAIDDAAGVLEKRKCELNMFMKEHLPDLVAWDLVKITINRKELS